HLGVVSGRDLVGLAGADRQARAVVHAHVEATGYGVAKVAVLAGARAGDRRHVLRPAPARLEDEAGDGELVEPHDVHPAAREAAHLVGRVEALALEAAHGGMVFGAAPLRKHAARGPAPAGPRRARERR